MRCENGVPRLLGVVCAHVDDFIITGCEQDPEWVAAVSGFHSKYRFLSWECVSYNHCGVAVREGNSEFILDQSTYCSQIEEIKFEARNEDDHGSHGGGFASQHARRGSTDQIAASGTEVRPIAHSRVAPGHKVHFLRGDGVKASDADVLETIVERLSRELVRQLQSFHSGFADHGLQHAQLHQELRGSAISAPLKVMGKLSRRADSSNLWWQIVS